MTYLLLTALLSLPTPTGPYHVGTSIQHLVDGARPDPVDVKHRREIMVQYWYPTEQAKGQMALYIPDSRLLDRMKEEGYYRQKKDDLEKWRSLTTNSLLNAPVSHRHRWPVLLFSHGLGVSRSNYTTYCEEFASKGYFVASIDTPHGGETIMPDGRIFVGGDDTGYGLPDKMDSKVHEWALDAKCVLDNLTKARKKLLDLRRVAMAGHSFGGAAAMELASFDSRLKAAVNLDGLPYGLPKKTGVRAPVLFFRSNPNYNDADHARLGRTRQEWEAGAKAGSKRSDETWAAIAEKSKGPIYHVSIRDTGHLSYSDALYTMPSTVTYFSNHSLAADRVRLISTRVMQCFLDDALFGRQCKALRSLKFPYPEVSAKRVK